MSRKRQNEAKRSEWVFRPINGIDIKDEMNILDTVIEMLTYSPDNTQNMDNIESHFKSIGENYFNTH